MSGKATRQYNLQRGTDKVERFCKRAEFQIVPLNNGYQLRVENLVDFYPVNNRYCILQSGERGEWQSMNDIRDIMLSAIPAPEPRKVVIPTAKFSGGIFPVEMVERPKRNYWWQFWRLK